MLVVGLKNSRYGGEEFVGLLPECNREGGVMLLEKIRAEVEGMNIPPVLSPNPPTTVLSVSAANECFARWEAQAANWFFEADQVLRLLIYSGRNRVVIAGNAV